MIRPPALNAVAGLAALAAVVASILTGAWPVAGLAALVAVLLAGQAVLLARRDRAAVEARRNRRERARRRTAAAEQEHRRLAAQLRERVLQDLAGVGYALGTDHPRLAEVVQGSIRTLREVLVDVEPPALTGDTLAAAVDDLTAGLRMAGTACVVRVPAGLPVSPAGAGLLWRAAREALRAAEAAVGVGRVEIVVAVDEDAVTLTVTDDGAPPPDTPASAGLDLLRDALTEAGGRLDGRSATVPVSR